MRLTIITFLLMRISNFLLCVRGGVSPDISAGIEGVCGASVVGRDMDVAVRLLLAVVLCWTTLNVEGMTVA